jgi:hypothetical protein
MPKKQTKQKQKQKQIQKQNVVQKVVVKLDSSGQKVKVKRRRRVKKEPEMSFDERYYRQLPAPVVYQSTQQVPLIVPGQTPAPAFNPPPQAQMINQPMPSRPFLEDLGMIGTEGPVEILDRPTKAEQLQDFITPTALKIYNEEFMKSLDEKAKYFKSLQEPMRKPFIQDEKFKFEMENINEDEIPLAEMIPNRTRRTKKETEEAKQMLKEDVASTGLAQFEPAFQPKPFNFQEEESVVSGINQNEPTTENISEVTKVFRRNTWADLLQRYQNLTGTPFKRRKGYKKAEFQALVEQMEIRNFDRNILSNF